MVCRLRPRLQRLWTRASQVEIVRDVRYLFDNVEANSILTRPAQWELIALNRESFMGFPMLSVDNFIYAGGGNRLPGFVRLTFAG